MKVDLGIWDRLSRLIILLLIAAALLAVGLWYLPLIQQNERMRKEILQMDAEIDRERRTNAALKSELDAQEEARTVERLARERLNYARPEETVIRFKPPAAGATNTTATTH